MIYALCQLLPSLVYLSYLKFCFQSTQMCDNRDDGRNVKNVFPLWSNCLPSISYNYCLQIQNKPLHWIIYWVAREGTYTTTFLLIHHHTCALSPHYAQEEDSCLHNFIMCYFSSKTLIMISIEFLPLHCMITIKLWYSKNCLIW